MIELKKFPQFYYCYKSNGWWWFLTIIKNKEFVYIFRWSVRILNVKDKKEYMEKAVMRFQEAVEHADLSQLKVNNLNNRIMYNVDELEGDEFNKAWAEDLYHIQTVKP